MRHVKHRVSIALLLILVAPMLIACGEDEVSQSAVSTVDSSITMQSSPQVIATPGTPVPPLESTPLPEVNTPGQLTSEELLEYQPNELGGIPVFMYHNVVTDPSLEGHLYRTADELYGDLQWMYDNNFYLVGMNAVVRGNLDVPAGKHPVVLTFDDGSSMHISFEMGEDGQPLKDEHGEYVVTRNSAVGVIDRFAADHPDFGKTAHFALVPGNLFSWPNHQQDEWYEEKLEWLVRNGYEVGNHTLQHPELPKLDTKSFARNIAEPYISVSNVVDKDHPNFAMGVLTLPYGAFQEGGWTGDKYDYLVNGFVWDGHPIYVEAALLVCCGPTPSPFNTDYRRLWIPRIAGDDPDIARLMKDIEDGLVTLYTSDGNPDTVTIPWPLPKSQWGKLNEEAITSRGLTLVKYHPETGRIYVAVGPAGRQAYTCVERARVSA